LVGAGYRTVGFDLHAGMLQSARRSCAKALVHQASVLAIPLRDECCEIVVCHGVVHNLAPFRQIERALRELARVTSPSGKISLNLFSDSHIDPCLTPTGQPGVFALPNAQRMTLLSPETIQNLAEAAGLALDGPATTYLSPGDPGQRSVWRAVLTRVRSIRAQKAAAACFL
jgi:ubiquinone/menaquinone biosynthesis C-methylase UbiE